jgi:hypothetical protein
LAGDADVLIVDNDTVRRNMSYYSPATKLQNPGDGIRAGYDLGAWSSRHDHALVTDNYTVGGQYALEIRSWDTIEVARNVAAGPRVAHAYRLTGTARPQNRSIPLVRGIGLA